MKPNQPARRRFLRRALSGVAAAAALPLVNAHAATTKVVPAKRKPSSTESETETPAEPGVWKNYSGTIVAHPTEILKPTSLFELQAAVRGAHTVRAVGSGHAYTQAAKPEETLIETKNYGKILSVDYDRMQVKVEAGSTLAQFNTNLADLGLALPSVGDIAYQTLGGLLSTGTHGTGMKWGSLSGAESLAGVEFVTADGSVLSLDESRPDDTELLKAARVSMGTLGVMYSATLKVVNAHNLRLEAGPAKLVEALKPENYRNNDHFEFWVFPFTDDVLSIKRNKTNEPRKINHLTKTLYHQYFMENALTEGILRIMDIDKKLIPGLVRKMAKLVPHEGAIDRSDKIMVAPRLFKVHLMEFGFPIKNCEAAVSAYQQLAEEFAKKPGHEAYYAHLPCEVRFIKGDKDAFLSHAPAGQETCYIDLTSHLSFHNYAPFFQAVEEKFLALGGRPHWGKHFYKNPMHLYPDADKFLSIRKKLDPGGKFLNDFAHRLFGNLNVY